MRYTKSMAALEAATILQFQSLNPTERRAYFVAYPDSVMARAGIIDKVGQGLKKLSGVVKHAAAPKPASGTAKPSRSAVSSQLSSKAERHVDLAEGHHEAAQHHAANGRHDQAAQHAKWARQHNYVAKNLTAAAKSHAAGSGDHSHLLGMHSRKSLVGHFKSKQIGAPAA